MNHIRLITLIKLCLFLALSVSMASCAVKEKESLKPYISNVSLNKKSFNPFKGEAVRIRYRLSKKARVAIRLYDLDDNLVRIIEPRRIDRGGYNEIVWDGKDGSGNILPRGAYIYTIEAGGLEDNESYLYDLTDETGGLNLTLRGLNFDYKTGRIDYLLPKAAMLRIRIGIKDGGPLLETLLDWQPKEAGKGHIRWDGTDSSNIMNLLGNRNVVVNIAAFSLPENCAILEGEKRTILTKGHKTQRRTEKKTNIRKNMHALHKRPKCHEPRFNFEILDISEYNDRGEPVITKDVVPVRITLDERDKMDLINSRFEIIFFMDNLFLFEEEEGTSPFTYFLDTKGLAEGGHILTINISNYEDHISSGSKKIFIRRI